MATYVETRDRKILIDPGAHLAPTRFTLNPHPLEKFMLKTHLERIELYARSCQIIIIPHYPDHHFISNRVHLFCDKKILMKNPNPVIDRDQRRIAFQVLRSIHEAQGEVSYVDDHTLSSGETRLSFSPVLPSRQDEKGPGVIITTIQDEEDCFVFSSEVRGLFTDSQRDYIIEQKPTFLYLDGPVSYSDQSGIQKSSLQPCLSRIQTVIEETCLKTLLLDHHLIRDPFWSSRIDSIVKRCHHKGVELITAAEFRGQDINALESRRSELYKNHPLEEF
ncbi:hypothetical protein BVY01_02380 [bacterium I07]|nr:hypothetical protein BVY01_02380 [bacterium I07]